MGLSFVVVRVRERLCALPLAPGMEMMRTPAGLSDGGEVPALLGLATLRGNLVPVLDLPALLGLAAGPPGARIVSTQVDGRCVAFTVDEVLGVRTLEPEVLTEIVLPGADDRNNRSVGRFAEGFARLVETAGMVPEQAWAALESGRASETGAVRT